MSCWDSYNIYPSDIRSDVVCGWISNDYPGCGSCGYCHHRNNHDREKITIAQQEFWDWANKNGKLFSCYWENQSGLSGTFQFRSSDLDQARLVAQESVYNWKTLLVQPVS